MNGSNGSHFDRLSANGLVPISEEIRHAAVVTSTIKHENGDSMGVLAVGATTQGRPVQVMPFWLEVERVIFGRRPQFS